MRTSSDAWSPIICFSSFFLRCCGSHRDLHSFPTRRSSDLAVAAHPPRKLVLFEGKIVAQDGAFISTSITVARSEEHTSELQSRLHLVCRLLLEKKKDGMTGCCRSGDLYDR